MKFKCIRELQSCKGIAYGGELVHKAIRLHERDWEALKEYARGEGTSAGEIVRVIIRDFLAGLETPPTTNENVIARLEAELADLNGKIKRLKAFDDKHYNGG